MGQYYIAVNLDKREFIHPHALNCGAKLLELGGMFTTALAVLLSDGNGRGGGDLHSKNPIIGSWAGDKIVLTGDYADDGKFVEDEPVEGDKKNLYIHAKGAYLDVSGQVLQALCDESYFRDKVKEDLKSGWLDPGSYDPETEKFLLKLKAQG